VGKESIDRGEGRGKTKVEKREGTRKKEAECRFPFGDAGDVFSLVQQRGPLAGDERRRDEGPVV